MNWYFSISPTFTVLRCSPIEWSIQDINTCKIWINYYHNSIGMGIRCANMFPPKGWGLQVQRLWEKSERWGRWGDSWRRYIGQMWSTCIRGGWSPMGASRGLSGHALSAIKMNLKRMEHPNDYLGFPKCSIEKIAYLPNCQWVKSLLSLSLQNPE